MRKPVTILLLSFAVSVSYAQDIEVEYDKNKDFTIYKSFTLGEGEIITPKDQRKVNDDQIHKWVRDAISSELKDKGLVELDTLADLSVTYIIGSLERSGLQSNTTGGLGGGLVMSDYEQSSFVIDMNDKHNFLVWRVNGVTSTTSPNAATMIDEVVAKGFKKFSIKPKKKKK
jgi:3-oxoacyl-(acyl-carrier-protein) synthase